MIEFLQFYEKTIKILLIIGLSALIGFDRERSKKPAGLRTHMIVGLTATLISIVAVDNFDYSGAGRIIAGVATGIGFIGAGTIIGSKQKQGLTTASTIWAVSGIGIAIGIGEYAIAIITTILILAILLTGKFEKSKKSK